MAIDTLLRFDGPNSSTMGINSAIGGTFVDYGATQYQSIGGFYKYYTSLSNVDNQELYRTTTLAYNSAKTLSLLVKLNAEVSASKTIMTFCNHYVMGAPGEDMKIQYIWNSGTPQLVFTRVNSITKTITLGTNKWHHLVFAFTDNTKMEAYVDGNLVGTTTSSSVTVSSGTQITVMAGYGATNKAWSGIDNFLIDNTAYSPAKVKTLYAFYKGAF